MRIRCESRWGAHTQMCSWTQIQVEQTRRVDGTSAFALTQRGIEWKRDSAKKKEGKQQCQVKVSEVDASNRCLIFYRANDKKWEEIVFICFLRVCCFCSAQLIFQKEQIYGLHTHTLSRSLSLAVSRTSGEEHPSAELHVQHYWSNPRKNETDFVAANSNARSLARAFFSSFSEQQHKRQRHGWGWDSWESCCQINFNAISFLISHHCECVQFDMVQVISSASCLLIRLKATE